VEKAPLDSENEKLINVFEAMEDGVSIVSKQHIIQYANAALEKDFGPAKGRKCYEYFCDSKKAFPLCGEKDVWAGKTIHKEWYSPKNKKIYESTDTPLTNPDGTVSMLHILHDITERKQTEEALQREKNKLAGILEAIEDKVCIIDKQYVIQYGNAALEKDHGPAEGRKCYEYFHDLKKVCPWCGNENVFEGKTIRREWHYTKDSKIYEIKDTTSKNLDGTIAVLEMLPDITDRRRAERKLRKKVNEAWFETIKSPIFDETKKVIEIVAISRNIAEHKRAEKALRESEQRYRTLVENQGEGVGITDTQENFIFANPAAHTIFGVPPGNLTGRNLREFFDDEGFAFILEQTKIRRAGKKSIYEIVFNRDDGVKHTMLVTATPRFDGNNKFTGTFAVFRDITEQKKAQEELLFKTALLEAQSETTIDGILVVDDEGKTALFNKRFGEMWNIPQQLLDTKDDRKILQYVLDQLKNPDRFLEKVKYLYGHKDQQSRDEIKFKDGKTFDRYSSPLIDSNGTYHGRAWYFRDITQQERAKEALKESEERYKTLFESSVDGILIAGIETRKFEYANPAICKLLGYTEVELKRLSLDDIHPKENLKHVISEFEAQAKGEKTLAQDIPCLRKDGTIMYADINASKALINARECNIGFFRDITERKRAEEMLRRLLRRNELVLQTSVDGFSVIDLEGKLLEVNSALCDMTGYSKEELVGMNIKEIEAVETPEEIAEHIKATTKQDYDRFETKHRRKDGKIVDVEVSTQLCELGQDKFFFSFWRDITEHKRLANEIKQYKQQILKTQRHVYIDSMGAIVAHQLNQPLTMINMLLGEAMDDLSNQPSVPEAVLRNLRESMSEAEKTASIISEFRRNVKEQSWGEIGQALVAETAEKVISALSDEAARAKLHITVEPLENLPTVKSTAVALEQIFFIIIQNAIEAADGEKWHNLNISAKSSDGKIEIHFSDDCCGIEPKNLEKIFEPFFTTKSGKGGMGLGLEIVHRIMITCGGNVWVESEIGKGTAFYVALPANDSVKS